MCSAHIKTVQEAYLNDHEELARRIDDLKRFWHQVDELGDGPKYEEMATRVEQFRRELEAHIEHEEQRPDLFTPTSETSSASEQVEELHREHAEMLRQLDEFSQRLRLCEGAYHCWHQVREDFDDFLDHLHEHEAKEERLLTISQKREPQRA
ncbi:MAG: hypothetical protein CMJ46_09340 [Planctomyces sp.]|nr:hypothetical protein [Planctomyces sp.]